ncbi:jmjC domain-containing protein 8-like [Hyalella azteca]|uniref:JmjC domain-containing protein 8-like n=1 Tax=Hyalella azteca TaxID=294128 RepID=A0A8B7N1D2_HYAAZ|nr:jmjC domain-containing protein 8-like [Hyalella azteca]
MISIIYLIVTSLLVGHTLGTLHHHNRKPPPQPPVTRFLDFILPDSDDGGWDVLADDSSLRLAAPGPCTVDVRHARDLTQQQFLETYAYNAPVIIVGASDNKDFRALTRRSSLLSWLGESKVRLSSANTYSYDKRDVTFSTYCHQHMKPQSLQTLANETFYLFGDHSHPQWLSLLEDYNIPPYSLPGHSPMLSFGVAGPGSGVPFHFHGPGFAETIWGRKRWFLAPPDAAPIFNPNRTTLQWLLEDYPKGPPLESMLECTLNPGELVYFPDRWWHATLNIDPCVFVSTFLSP